MDKAKNSYSCLVDRSDAEEFLLKKNISNHPHIQDSVTGKDDYEVADLMAEFACEMIERMIMGMMD